MKEERIMTLHPQGKKGVNILKEKYEQVKHILISFLEEKGEMEYKQLNDLAIKKLTGSFDGKIPWYVVTVKLDLEARGIIERVPGTSPHRVRCRGAF